MLWRRGAAIRRFVPSLLVLLLIASSDPIWVAVRADEPVGQRPIRIVNPRKMPAEPLAAQRIPLGLPNDYKPWIVRLKGGDLLVVAFCFGGQPSNKLPPGQPYLERAVFWRSQDGGRTWGARDERPDLHGREFALTCLSDGTLLMPCHFLSNDAANKAGHTYSKLFRSVDEGKSWTEQRVGPEGFPDKAQTSTDWTPVELPDPERPGATIVQWGGAMQEGGANASQHVYLWRSRDSGATWDKTLVPDTDRWSDVDGFFSQSVTYRNAQGTLWHPVRVDASGPHWRLPAVAGVTERSGDQDDRTMLWKSIDNGRTWRRHTDNGRFGTYGEMYPRFLRLLDGRLLLTFTVRSNPTDGHPLGLRALVSDDDGESWDFSNDRIVLADRNWGVSGGGFGNTVQNDDGTLVSVYSYRGEDDATHIEAVRWRLPPARAPEKTGQSPVKSPSAAPRFSLPDGFTIEQVAGPPLVQYPLFGCLDDEGRLYVAEGTGRSVPGPELVEQKLGKITRLEDTDGDGRFDTSTLYADGLVFPQGVLWHDGAVYVASHPAIWKFEDTDGDGKADRRQELVGRFRFNGNGCDIHGPFLGPDGRIYWTDGRHGYQIERPDGTKLEGLASRIWRCRTDGSELERIAGGGFDNPIELAWTRDAEMLGTMDQGAGDCLLHYVEGGVYPEDHPCVKEFVRTGPLLNVVHRYSVELPAALCGTMRYRSNRFGPEFVDSLVTTHYMTHKLVRTRLVRHGSTFRAEDTDFLVSTDPHLRLTDVLEDADGSLLTIDMGAWFTYGFLGNVLPRPDLLGALYRVRRTDAPPLADPRGKTIAWNSLAAPALVELLGDARPVVSDRAISALVRLGGAAVPMLAQVALSSDRSDAARTAALWSLCRIGTPEAISACRHTLEKSMQEMGDATAVRRTQISSVAHVATSILGLHRDGAARPVLQTILTNSIDLALQRKAAEALGRIGDRAAVPALLHTMSGPVDRFLEHSVTYALIQLKDRDATASGLRSPHARVRQAALIALDQMPQGQLTRRELAEQLLVSDEDELPRVAIELLGRRTDWNDLAREVLSVWLTAKNLKEDEPKLLTDFLVAFAQDPEIQQTMGKALGRNTTTQTVRQCVIHAMTLSRVDPIPTAWVAGMTDVLKDADERLKWETLDAIRSREWRQFDDLIRSLGRDTTATTELRVAALEALAKSARDVEQTDFEFLMTQLTDDAPPLVRLAAARTLAISPLNTDQRMQVAARTGKVSTMLLRLLLPIFSRKSDPLVGRTLLEALNRSPGAEALTTAEIDQLVRGYPADVVSLAMPLREKLAARQRDRTVYLTSLRAELGGLRGNADAGKEVFLAPKNNCFACHRAVGRGGVIGPDLSKVGQFRTRDELLESIVFPSLSIAPQFQTHSVATRDGRSLTGVVTRETADALFLRSADLAERRLERTEIEEVVPSTTTLMPDGLEKQLSRQQLADLIEFLLSQK